MNTRTFAAWKFDLLDRMSIDRRLSAIDFRVAYCLLSYMDAATGDCFPMQETIIAETGACERAVRDALANLRACGWLSIERIGSRKRGRAQNHYRFPGRDYRHACAATGRDYRHAGAGKKGATTGVPARKYRQLHADASPIEQFEYRNTLDKEGAHARTTARERGTRIPENFSPDLSVAMAAGMSLQQAELSALNFLDFWKSKPGAAGRKLDWAATWRMWARNDAAKAQRNGPDRQKKPHIAEQALEALREAYQREHQGKTNDEDDNGAAGFIPPRVRH